jgi:hypothetical protein
MFSMARPEICLGHLRALFALRGTEGCASAVIALLGCFALQYFRIGEFGASLRALEFSAGVSPQLAA